MTTATLVPPPLPPRLRAQLESVVAALAERSDVAIVILFGSWAEGRGREDSDVDLLVVADTPDRLHLTMALAELVRPMLEGRALDLIVIPSDQWGHSCRIRGMVAWEADRFGVRLV